MPRTMPPGWMDTMGRKGAQIETHTTLQILIDNGDILRVYRFASARLTIKGAVYEAQLQRSSRIKWSLQTKEPTSGTVSMQNVDTEIGREFLALGDAIYGAKAEIGRYARDLNGGFEGHKIFLTGPVVDIKPDENIVQLTAVSRPYSNISVGATRLVDPICQWLFKDPSTCGDTSPFLTCNLLINHVDGCQGRHGDPLKRAKFGGFISVNSGSRFKTI